MANNENSPNERISWLANTVHEIRTPVQTIIGTLDLLSETELNEEQAEYVRQIQFSSDILLSLINDILDFAKIRSHKLKLELIPFNLVTLIEQVADLVSLEAFTKKVELVTDVADNLAEFYVGDPTRIQEILLNIIKNAVKFTNEGYIRAAVEKAVLNGESGLLFSVTDTGIGVVEEKRKLLFTEFYQAEASTMRKYGGSGLGLAICQGLVLTMRGQIGMKPNPGGQGSVFWFFLPLKAARSTLLEDAGSESEKDDFSMQPDTKILIVDDNEVAAQSLCAKLGILGLRNIHCAENADEAIKKLFQAKSEGKKFDLVFIDMVLPRVDGWHLASEINALTSMKGMKLYLLVPEGQMGVDAKMRLMRWFTGYLYKPIKRDKLKKLLHETYDTPTDVEPIMQRRSGIADLDAGLAQGLEILVVEDHLMNRRLLCVFLQKYGAKVFEAENGEIAVEQIKRHQEISMIFMDIQMPVLDGLQATRQIRGGGYAGTIVACTADNDPSNFANYRKAGMNEILIKPFKRDAVKALLEKWKNKAGGAASAQQRGLLRHAQSILGKSQDNSAEDAEQAASVGGGLDLWHEDEFLDTVSGNVSLGGTLLSDFCQQTASLLSAAPKSILEKDFETLRRIGHTLAGSAGTISSARLAKGGKNFNLYAKAENIAGLENCLKALTADFGQFKKLTNKWKKKYGFFED